MKIDRNNYEAYFLDYTEGKLSTAEIAVLMAFIAENPDLKSELEDFESITLTPTRSIFIEKELLKKDITNILHVNDSNFDELCIARLEGDLDKETEALFETYLQENQGKLKEYKLYLKTILESDKSIVFDEKRRLKHFKISRPKTSLVITIAAAASIALILMVFMFLQNNKLRNNTIVYNPGKAVEPVVITVEKPFSAKKQLAVKQEQKSVNKPQLPEDKSKILHVAVSKRDELIPLTSQARLEPTALKPSIEPESLTLAYVLGQNRNIIKKESIARKEKYLTINEMAKEEMMKVIENQKIVDKNGIDLWALAKSGLAQINRFTGANIELKKEQDSTDNRIRVEFNTGLLGYYTSKNDE